jgi:phosphoribosylanthranilate isomerase
MITQIYEVINIDEAKAMVDLGVDFIGVVVSLDSNYPGVLNLQQANEVLKGVTGQAKKIILPFSKHLKDIVIMIEQTKPDIVHIAVEPEVLLPDDIQTLEVKFPEIKFMRTIPVENENSIELAKQYDGIADYLLLDSRSKKNSQLGVTGETHDWNISRKIVESVSIPVILAGGIGPDNVAEAILKVRPFGVDSKTKTDKTGTNEKDFEKVKEFVRIAKETKYVD